MEHPPPPSGLPDHAAQADDRGIHLDEVGVADLRLPIQVWDRAHGLQHTVARMSLSVALPADARGTHMSRLVAILLARRGEITLATLPDLLAETRRRLDAESARIEARFPYFLARRAPVSGAPSTLDVDCRFEAEDGPEGPDFVLHVTVPVTTLCPCSKAISRYGAHNQRGEVTVSVRSDEMVWIEEVVEAVESCASAPLFGVLKREDEKWVTERAYERPRFVEDLAREVVLALGGRPGVRWLRVEVVNHESIHNHAARAVATWPHAAHRGAPPAPPAPHESCGAWFRRHREAMGLSQAEAARRAGLSPSALSRIESGARQPTAAAAEALAGVLGLDPTCALLRAGHLPPHLAQRVAADPEGFLAWANGGQAGAGRPRED